jgi:redox-regulated HSP33 family molecular chaperone
MKCKGPLGGFNVECTSEGTLRGYAEKKVLDDFDGLGKPDARKVIGEAQYQVTRSVPGRILSQGISTSIDGYLTGSLQRKACIRTEIAVSDEVEVREVRGVMVEILPDSKLGSLGSLGSVRSLGSEGFKDPLLPLLDSKDPLSLSVASRNILKQLGLENAELRKTTPLKFACRCSPDRAIAMLAALSDEERRSLPPSIDITCHMCGKTFTVKTK